MEHLFLFLDLGSSGINKGSCLDSKNSFFLTFLGRPHCRSKPISFHLSSWLLGPFWDKKNKQGRARAFPHFTNQTRDMVSQKMEYQTQDSLEWFCLYEPFCVWEKYLCIHFKIQMGRTPLDLLWTFRTFQYWLYSSCKLWEKYIWALFWWENNSSSPLILPIIRSFFFLSAHVFPNHFAFLLSLSLEWKQHLLVTPHYDQSSNAQNSY